MTWWRIQIKGPEAEELSYQIGSMSNSTLGGIEVLNGDTINLYAQSSEDPSSELRELIQKTGLAISSVEAESDKDWCKAVESQWNSVQVGQFNIIPVLEINEESKVRKQDKNSILIVPGSGFGTGFSLTTQSAILAMESEASKCATHEKILDVGTGSGILSIIATKLFPKASITATDIAESVIENAEMNINLNGCEKSIRSGIMELSTLKPFYSVIIANIEFGVHLDLMKQYNRLSALGTILILAGIRDSIRAEQIILLLQNSQSDKTARWEEINTIQKGEWSAVTLRRAQCD